MTFSLALRRTFLPLLALAVSATSFAGPPLKHHAKKKKPPVKTASVGEYANFASWKSVSEFIDMMVAQHEFNRTELEAIFNKTRYVDSAIKLIKPAPVGTPKNWRAYRARFVEPIRIAAGVEFWNANAETLERAQTQYGVPAEIIVGIIGVETIFGRNTGSFRVMDALTTLAFDYPDTPNRAPRMELFRSELENTLLYARESGIDPLSLSGSYAGAIGWPQFMPSSIRKYGVDYDGDNKIDLRNSPADAIGSVAHFLSVHGWKSGEPYVFPVTVTAPDENGKAEWEKFIGQGLKANFTLADLRAGGVTPGMEPPPDMLFSLVDLQNGTEATEYWLGAPNFFAITQYNRSYFYAMSVIDLARAVRTARNK